MNPYLKFFPTLPPEFVPTELLSQEVENSLKQLIRQYNLLTYIEYSERLPDQKMLMRDLRQRGNTVGLIPPLLWVLGQSYELLAVPMMPEVERFDQIHFLVNNNSLIESMLRTLAQEAGTLHQKVTGMPATFAAIRSVNKNEAYYSERTADHRKLFIQCRLITVLTDYRELFQRDQHLMDPKFVQERRQAAVKIIERLYAKERGSADSAEPSNAVMSAEAVSSKRSAERTQNLPVVEMHSVEKPKADVPQAKPVQEEEELYFTGLQVEVPDPPSISEQKLKDTDYLPQRATDRPEWMSYEASQKDSLNWSVVLRTFGANMVIRILVRRQDYGQLLSMFEADFISESADLQYCQDSLGKVLEHNDLLPEKEEEYWRLHQYLKGRHL